MTCQSIVSPPPATLDADMPVAGAASVLIERKCSTLPVVDAQGRFAGVFGTRELIGLMLPRAVRLGDGLGELGFVADNSDDLRSRLTALGDEPVSKHMSPHPTVRPETALVEALLMLYRGDAFLPVVDASGRLLGIATAAGALGHIAGNP
jgi:CBS-domain-containing membrane protein